MGYPYGKTYLEQIQDLPKECEEIRNAFYVLRSKYVKDHPKYEESIDLSIKENFMILGEAFELTSSVIGSICDDYHFMWDVIDALLTPKKEENNE